MAGSANEHKPAFPSGLIPAVTWAKVACSFTLAVLSIACGGASSGTSPTPTTPAPVAGSAFYVFVNPTLLGVGETGRALSGLRLPDSDVTTQTSWQSLSPAVAAVSSNGVVTAMSSGVALIQGQYKGAL